MHNTNMSCEIFFFCKHSISAMFLVSPSTSQHSLFLIPICLNILPCFEPALQFTGFGKGREQENFQHPKSLLIFFSTGQAGHEALNL